MQIKKNNRILSYILAMSMIFLSGCQGGDKDTRTDTSVLPESLQGLDFSEHLDISIGYWNIDEMVKSSDTDGMTAYIEDLFNITLVPISVTWSNYKEKYQIFSATGNLPDLFATLTISSNDSNDSAYFVDMIEKGSIQALPEDLSAFPLISATLEDLSYTSYTDGKYYAIPRTSFNDPILGSTDAAMLVRRDWMDALGLDDPQSFEEFQEMLTAFATEDPDGNGLDDTIGYNVNSLSALGKWVILGIAPECNVYSWIEEDGRYVPSWTTAGFENVITAFHSLYNSQGLDPDFYSKNTVSVMEDFASGRLGALEYKSSPNALREVEELWTELNDKSFSECVDVLPIFPAPDGVRYSNSSGSFWSESYISSTANEEKVTRILAMIEFLLSDEGQKFCKYGLEGVDYKLEEDGSYTCLLDTGEETLTAVLMEKYPSYTFFSGIATWGGSWLDFEDNTLNNLRFGETSTTLARKSLEWLADNTTQLERPYDFLNFPKEPSETFSTANAFEAFISCIISTGDPLEKWADYLQKLEDAGLDNYIDRQNENFQNKTF